MHSANLPQLQQQPPRVMDQQQQQSSGSSEFQPHKLPQGERTASQMGEGDWDYQNKINAYLKTANIGAKADSTPLAAELKKAEEKLSHPEASGQ